MSRITPNSNASAFSSQSIGQGFIKFIYNHEKQSLELDNALDFVTSKIFLSTFGSSQLIKLINTLISKYPAYSYSLERLIKSLINTSIYYRIADLINELPDELAKKLEIEKNASIFQSFTISEENISNINSEDSIPTFSSLEFKSPIVSLSDVFNEKVKDIMDNPQNFSQFLDQFQPFSVSDIADFISNLVSPNTPFVDRDSTNDRNILALLRPFKSQTKISVDELIAAFDREFIFIRSQSSFQLFINCIKEVTSPRSVPVYPFFGKWQHPLTQLNFITYIINSNTSSLTFPKPVQIPHLNLMNSSNSSIIIGDFKSEIWRCPDFIETLAYLYDSSEIGVDQILGDALEKGPTLLLLVLALNPKVSRFATHLVRLLLISPTQYMPGFSALWAANESFFIDLITALYEEQHVLIGRFLDVIDDLAIFDTFIQKCSLKMAILLNITAFFRRSFNFQDALLKLYEKDKENTLNICFNIVENPVEYGFSIDHTERRISKDEVVTADLVFYRFINEIYSSFNPSLKQRVNSLFDKCISRSSDLTRYTFLWRKKKEPPMSPKSPAPAKESDFIELATATDFRGIFRYQSIVNSLLLSFPKEKNAAHSNGKTLGKLLSLDLLNQKSTTQALKMIDQGIHLRENTTGFTFAVAALEELSDNFDLYLPFTKHLILQEEFKKACPSLYSAAEKVCNEPEINIHQAITKENASNSLSEERNHETVFQLYEQKINKLDIPPCLERFKYVKFSIDRMKHENYDIKNKSNWDTLSLYYMKILAPTQINTEIANNCVEAAIYLVYEYLNGPNCRSNKTICMLTRLGRYLGLNTLSKNKPIYSRLLDVPKLLLFGYTNSALCAVIPFIYAVFENASSIFRPPNSWTVSILSILGSFARIPYLNNSLYLLIIKFFHNFNVTLNDVEPFPLRRLKIEYITTSDFLYPPLDFTSSLTMVSTEKLLSGDFVSLLHVVHEHLVLSDELEKIRSGIVREIGFFIYTKMSSIANTATTTSYDLVLKDFARCQDPTVVDRHARALLHQYTNALSMMAVSLISDAVDPTFTNTIHRDVIHKNSKWIDQIVRQLSYSIGLQTLLQRLKPIQKLRSSWNHSSSEEQTEGNGSTCNISINANSISISPNPNSSSILLNKDKEKENANDINAGFGGYCGSSEYWDVKSFPPSIAQRIPQALWPPSIKVQSSLYTRKVDNDSLVPSGIFECFNVDSDIRRAYSSLSINSFPLYKPKVYPSEIQFIPQIAQWIFDLFIIDQKTGQVTSVKHTKQYPPITSVNPFQMIATIIYCFPLHISKAAASFGVDLVKHYFLYLQQKDHSSNDELAKLQPKVHRLLWNNMPNLAVFAEMVREKLVAPNFFETITMHFIDQPISNGCDFSPLVRCSLDILQDKSIYPHSIERLMSFLCTCANNNIRDNIKENGNKNGNKNDNSNDKKDDKKDNENKDNKDELNDKGDDDSNKKDILDKDNDNIDSNMDKDDMMDSGYYPNYPYNNYGKIPKNNYKGSSLSINNNNINNDIIELTKKWHTYQIFDEHTHTIIPKSRHDQKSPLFTNFDQCMDLGFPKVVQFIKGISDSLRTPKFWEDLIAYSFPDQKTELLKFFYASLAACEFDPNIFLCFLREAFNAISYKKISLDFFASILANITLQLRGQFATYFGGFLNDTRPIKQCSPYAISSNILCHYPFPYPYANPQLMGAWLYIFPLVVQPLLLNDEVFLPTSLLVVAMLNILARFPLNWGDYNEYRKCYKGILRIILLIIHDCPRFVRGYYFDFISVIPLHFRKLRNIILTCGYTLKDQAQNFSADRFILSKFAILKNERFERILSVGYIPNDAFNEMISEWNKTMFSLYEIGPFFIYSFRYLFYSEKQIDENAGKMMLKSIVHCILYSANTLRNAMTVVECLFDMLRFNCKQTLFFIETIVSAFNELELNWDSVTIQEIIFTVLMQRSFRIQPVPFGVIELRKLLEPKDNFKKLLSIFEQNIANSNE